MHRLADVVGRFAGPWIALVLVTATCQREKPAAAPADHQATLAALKAHLEKGELPAAEALGAKLAGTPIEGDVLFALGEHFEDKDDPRAFDTLGRAVDHLSRAGQHGRAAAAARLQSRSAWSAVRYQDALAALDRCLVEADKAGDTTQSSRALMNLFLILYELNDLTGARRALDDAARKGASAGPPIPALLAFNRGMLAQAEGHPAVARASFQQVLQLSASAPKSEFAWNSHLNLLTLALEAGDLTAARQAHAAARPLFEQAFGKRASSRVAWGLHSARLSLLDKQPQQALTALAALEADKPDVRQSWRIAHERGRALRLLGRTKEAIAAFQQAADLVEGLRAEQFDDFKSWVVAKRQEPFVALFELHAARGETREAWTVLERTQGRTFLEAFAASTAQAAQGRSRGEVSQRFDALKRLYPILRASPVLADVPYDQLSQGLRGDQLIAFFEGSERLFVLAVAGGRPRVIPGPSLAQLRPLVAGFLENPGDRTRADALGAALFPRGVLPAPGGRLYLSPSTLLARLPFAAVSRRGRYLVEDFALAEVPGGRALLALKRRPAGNGAPPLVLADASGDLPQAALEGREVAEKLGPTARLLAGPAARSERLREGPSPAVLHLALHSGVGPTGPWLSLADRPVLASELIDWKVGASADLVVLASCASAATRDPGLWGSLASAFLAAGSRSVVASLWSTPDTVSRALVNQLYQQQALRDPVAALAAAQRAQIAAGKPPEDWAGFAFYGAGAPPPPAGKAEAALLSPSPSEKREITVTDSTIIKTVLALGLLAGKCVPGPDPDPGPVKDAGVDVAPDVSPDVTPDLAPDLAPDAAPDLTPDAGIDLTPDAAPDLAPDVVQRNPVVIPASANTTMMIYPTAGDESGCTDEGGPRYLLTVTGAGACVPAALEPLNPVILLGIQRCQTGSGCVPCTDDSCLPRSCFQPFPQAGPGDCAYELPVIEGDRTHYLFFPNVDADNPPPQRTGLPFLLRVTKVNDSVSILPPHDRPFLVGRLRQEPYFRDEVAEAKCGDDLCGIFLFAPPPSGLSWFFGASISNNLALW